MRLFAIVPASILALSLLTIPHGTASAAKSVAQQEGVRLRNEARPVGLAVRRAGRLMAKTTRQLRSSGVSIPIMVLATNTTHGEQHGTVEHADLAVTRGKNPELGVTNHGTRISNGEVTSTGDRTYAFGRGPLGSLKGLHTRKWTEAVGRAALEHTPTLTAANVDRAAAGWLTSVEATARAAKR